MLENISNDCGQSRISISIHSHKLGRIDAAGTRRALCLHIINFSELARLADTLHINLAR